MKIKSIQVSGFRSVKNETLQCEQLTALVGANGSGKSCFLRALDLFYSATPKVSIDDFYDRDPAQAIVVAVCYHDLSKAAVERFSSYVQGDTLTVERVFRWDGAKIINAFHGSALQNPMFSSVRSAASANEKKTAYEAVRQTKGFDALPKWKNQTDALNALRQWEAEHQEECSRQRDEGKFFGFTEVGQGYLGDFTRFLFIPAIRDAAGDATEAKGSVLTELMDLVVRSVLADSAALKEFRENTRAQYNALLEPSKLTQLSSLTSELSSTLQVFAPGANVDLQWLPLEDLSVPLPRADVRLVEDGFASGVTRTGHGLQRAFILTMLQHLAKAQSKSSESAKEGKPVGSILPTIVLAIEEPELYQHPSRQRHLAKVLYELAAGSIPGIAESTQILYCTHSPLFVGLDRFNQVRLLRKVDSDPGKPKISRIIQTALVNVAEELWKAAGGQGEKFTDKTLGARLQSLMTPWMSEGFFAQVVVLVEGEDDRAALLGIADALGYDFERAGVSVIPCGGKSSLDRPLVIFRQLGIPTYVVWDGDNGDLAGVAVNRMLLSLFQGTLCDFPPTQVKPTFACFETKLEQVLQTEIGPELFTPTLQRLQTEFGILKKAHALKNPVVVATLISEAAQNSRLMPTLRSIVDSIWAMVNTAASGADQDEIGSRALSPGVEAEQRA